MKKAVFLILFFMCIFINAQKVISNTEGTKNKNASRVFKLKIAATANDETGEFIFKMPRDIVPIEDGIFFLIDDGKVLKFEKSGKFSGIIVKKGQGPGEATHLYQLYKRNNELIVNTGFMGKLMVFDFKGFLKSEYKSRPNMRTTSQGLSIGESAFRILGTTKTLDFIVIYFSDPEGTKVKGSLKRYSVNLLSKKNDWIKRLFEIPMKAVIYKTPIRKILLAINNLTSASNDRYIYFCNTERYEIKIYNIESNKIEAIRRRKYNPVKIPLESKGNFEYGETFMYATKKKSFVYKANARKDFVDIQRLFFVKNCLWVITSTVDNDKGVLVDLFDIHGNYIDKFYLSFNGNLNLNSLYSSELCINEQGIFVREFDSEDNYKVVIYKIPDDICNNLISDN